MKALSEIIQSPETEIHQVLLQVAPDFPGEGSCVIDHTHPNKQVATHFSQIDADRMDYSCATSIYWSLMETWSDSYPPSYSSCRNGIAFQRNGMHAIEDYVLSRYQMYMQVYFHPATRAMEVLHRIFLKRAKELYPKDKDFFYTNISTFLPFFWKNVTLSDYLALDDGVMNTISSSGWPVLTRSRRLVATFCQPQGL